MYIPPADEETGRPQTLDHAHRVPADQGQGHSQQGSPHTAGELAERERGVLEVELPRHGVVQRVPEQRADRRQQLQEGEAGCRRHGETRGKPWNQQSATREQPNVWGRHKKKYRRHRIETIRLHLRDTNMDYNVEIHSASQSVSRRECGF